MRRKHKPSGRYADVSSAPMPGGAAFDAPGVRNAHLEIAHGRVRDPSPDSVLRLRDQRVMVNARCDVLETMHRRDRLSVLAYACARRYQDVLEHADGFRSPSHSLEPRDGTNAATAHEWAIVMRIETAKECLDHKTFVREHLGRAAAGLLESVLLWPGTLQGFAATKRLSSSYSVSKLGRAFVDACEELVRVYDLPSARRTLFKLEG